jgi:hypothetical protein
MHTSASWIPSSWLRPGGFVIRDPLPESIELEWFEQTDPDTPYKAHVLSDGTLRFICLTTLLMQPIHLLPDTVLIDEPELGLRHQPAGGHAQAGGRNQAGDRFHPVGGTAQRLLSRKTSWSWSARAVPPRSSGLTRKS